MIVFQKSFYGFILILCLFRSNQLLACSCPHPATLERALKESQYVLTGTVIQMDTIRVVGELFHSRKGVRTKSGRLAERLVTKLRYQVAVDSVLKCGELIRDTITVLVDDNDCKPMLLVGGKHLISVDQFIECKLALTNVRRKFDIVSRAPSQVFQLQHCNYFKILKPPQLY